MGCHIHSWTRLFAKLGISRKWRRSKGVATYGRRLRFEHCENRCMLATFSVNSIQDNTIPGDGFTTLREAVVAANQFDDHDTI